MSQREASLPIFMSFAHLDTTLKCPLVSDEGFFELFDGFEHSRKVVLNLWVLGAKARRSSVMIGKVKDRSFSVQVILMQLTLDV